MAEEIEVYNYDKAIETQESKIEDSEMSKAEKKSIADFVEYLKAEGRNGISPGRHVKTLYTMQILRDTFGLFLDHIDKENIRSVVAKVNDSDYAAWSKHDIKSILKRFIKFMEGDSYNPDSWKHIKVKMAKKDKQKKKLREDELLAVSDVDKMVACATNSRDKALVPVAYESGGRPSEYLTLKYGDVKFDANGAIINLRQSKTFTRKIRLVNSAPYLRAWCNVHPTKAPDSPLWITFSTTGEHKAVGLAAFRKTLMILANRAGICKLENPTGKKKKIVVKSGKRVYPYLLRHSRITHMLRNPRYTLAGIKYQVGWDEDTMQISTYQHISDESFDEMTLAAHGITKEADTTPLELEGRLQCFNCKEFNGFDAKVCQSCGFSLDMTEVAATMQHIKNLLPMMSKIQELYSMNDDQLKKEITAMRKARADKK